jgi:hypothetical protein
MLLLMTYPATLVRIYTGNSKTSFLSLVAIVSDADVVRSGEDL